MRLFKKQKKEAVSNNELAEKIAGNIIARQRLLADFLNRKMVRFPRNRITYALFIFCVAFGGYCTYLLIASIIN